MATSSFSACCLCCSPSGTPIAASAVPVMALSRPPKCWKSEMQLEGGTLQKMWKQSCSSHRVRVIRATMEGESKESGNGGEGGTIAAVGAALLSKEQSAMLEAVSAVSEAANDAEDAGSKVTISSNISPELAAIYATCKWWTWRGYRINYSVQGTGPAVLLVHGFGASLGHWRRNIGVLARSNRVYAIDLLGLGASEKPARFVYTMETWAELLLDFIQEVIGESTVLIGNSIGSLACTIVAAGRMVDV